MSLKIYINGTLFDKQDAKISVYDHGLLYGDGVFEGLRCYAGQVFRMREHLDRLWTSAAKIELTIPISAEEMEIAINSTLAANDIRDGYIRLIVTRGVGTLGLDPNKCDQAQVIIITDMITLYPDEFYENGLAIVTANTIRNHPRALDPQIKSLNYLNNILAKIEGLKAGCVEALMLNHEGEVAECTGDNVFMISKGVLYTPPLDAGSLRGITRGAVIDLAAKLNLPCREQALTRYDLWTAEECFLTGTAAEVIPCVEVDHRSVGSGQPGEMTKRFISRFREKVTTDGQLI